MIDECRHRLAFSAQLKLRHAGSVQCIRIALAEPSKEKEDQMKLIPIAAVLAALAFVPAVLAQTTAATPANKADCEKAKMKWDAKGGADKKGACVAAAPAKTDKK